MSPLEYASMRQLHAITLAFIILLSQLGSIEHVYHEHDSGEACEYCLSAQPLDMAVLGAEIITPAHSLTFQLKQPTLSFIAESCFNHYSARAPPSFT